MADEKLLKFPCEYPIKVMGRNTMEFEPEMLAIFGQHVDIRNAAVRSQLSGSEKFLSVTVTFRATSQAQLDALYRELTANKKVLFCL